MLEDATLHLLEATNNNNKRVAFGDLTPKHLTATVHTQHSRN
jgi:hypothetical protein